jgi:RNA polymerase sigma-70 factor, ECF subfamily
MDARAEVQAVVREHRGWVLARLLRSVRDIDLAEDALQLALEAALVQWPRAGVPDHPRAWLVSAAKNRAIDELRRRTLHADKEEELAWLEALTRPGPGGAPDDAPIRDDMLRLVFTCCHPSLAEPSQVALTLHTIAGLETDEIARAFLVPSATMAQRLVRAKQKILAARVPYAVPEARELPARVHAALGVVYLVFNEGYSATRGDTLLRRDLCRVAIGLGRELTALMPDAAEVSGLLALMLLTDARSAARMSDAGELVLLEEQDRAAWDAAQVAEGIARTRHALTLTGVGPYALQAAIAAVHSEAARADQTDWPQIVALYDELLRRAPTPVVALNRAVAVAMVDGPARGLSEMAALDDALDGYHLLHAARGALLERAGEHAASLDAYRRALSLCQNEAEQRFLRRRVERAQSRTRGG